MRAKQWDRSARVTRNQPRAYFVYLLVLVLTVALLVPAAASAAEKFTASKVGASLSHETLVNNVFTVTGSTVKCGITRFEGVTEALESAQQTVVPGYEECTAFGFPSTVDTSGCIYRFTANGDVHLESCSKGGITVLYSSIFGKCHLLIKNQTAIKAASYANNLTEGKVGDIDITINATGLHTEVTQSTGICPLTAGTHTNAQTTYKVRVSAVGGSISVD